MGAKCSREIETKETRWWEEEKRWWWYGEAAITRDAIRKAMLRLATNDAFLDAIASELGQ